MAGKKGSSRYPECSLCVSSQHRQLGPADREPSSGDSLGGVPGGRASTPAGKVEFPPLQLLASSAVRTGAASRVAARQPQEGGREGGGSLLSLQSLVTSRGLLRRLFASPCLVSWKNWGGDGWAVALCCLLFRLCQLGPGGVRGPGIDGTGRWILLSFSTSSLGHLIHSYSFITIHTTGSHLWLHVSTTRGDFFFF